jgi:DNA polymerase III alpha subunit (gram-positive type)
MDAKVLSLTCDRVVDSASMNKVHEDLTERFSQLQMHVDSLATTSYVDQVQTNLAKLIPTMVQNGHLTDQVTREEITKVRDEMHKVRISNMETLSNHTKSVLESLSLSYKGRAIEGRIKHVGEKADSAHNTAVQAQSLVVGLQPQVQSNTLRITEIATSLEDLRTSVNSQVDTVMSTCKDLRELLIKHTSLPDVNNPSETIDLADVLSVLGPLLNETGDQIGKAISKADNAFNTAIDTMTNLSGLHTLLETTNKRLDSDHSQLMEESEHNTLCLWQHVKLLRDHVDTSWRTQVGYPPEDTDGTVPRFVNSAPTWDTL